MSQIKPLIPIPYRITFNEWAIRVRTALSDESIPIPPESEKNWRPWATSIQRIGKYSYVPIPLKLAYPNDEDWRIWASEFLNYIQ